MPRKQGGLSPARVQDALARWLPEPLDQADGFDAWYEPLRWTVMLAVLRLHEEVGTALEEVRERVFAAEGRKRQLWRLTGADSPSLMKSPASLRSKLGRELCEREARGRLPRGRLSVEQVEALALEVPDLGRFRVVCDYLQDLERARRVLLPGARRILLGRYPLAGRVKDYLRDLSLRHPARGHRAVQFAAELPAHGKTILVEVQLMTRLQDVWDQRNHPIYEWSREGGMVSPSLVLTDVALAESLYLLDEQASRVWTRFVRLSRRAKR